MNDAELKKILADVPKTLEECGKMFESAGHRKIITEDKEDWQRIHLLSAGLIISMAFVKDPTVALESVLAHMMLAYEMGYKATEQGEDIGIPSAFLEAFQEDNDG